MRIFAIFALSLTAAPARADIITMAFTGTVTDVNPAFVGSFSNGQALTGSYTFDTAVAPRSGSNSQFAVFDALTALSFTVGTYSASSAGAPEIQVDNNPPAPFVDRYGIVSRVSDGLTGPPIDGNNLFFFGFRLDDNDNTAFTNALTMPTSLTLSDFENRQFFLFVAGPSTPFGPGQVIGGSIDTLTVVTPTNAVPAPPGLVLAAMGGVVVFLRRRR